MRGATIDESSTDALLRDPLVIVGAPRSGTTFMARLLGISPSLGLAHEPRLLWRYGNDRCSDLLSVADARPDVRAHIRARLAAEVRRQSAQRLVEKTPSNSLRLPFVDAVLPGARFVHIIRDGRDAVASTIQRWATEGKRGPSTATRARLARRVREASWRQRAHYAGEAVRRMLPTTRRTPPVWGPRLPGMTALVNEVGVVGVAALQWRTCVELARHHGVGLGDRYLEVRYEQLDATHLRRILDFADLPDDGPLVETFTARFSRPAEPSRHALDAAQRDLVDQWIAPTQRALGYE